MKEKKIIGKDERIKEGYVPDDEVNDFYNALYKLRLSKVSHERKDEDQSLRDLEQFRDMAVALVKKMKKRQKHPDYLEGLEKSKRREKK